MIFTHLNGLKYNMGEVLISVIIPILKYHQYIVAAIRSILEQTHKNLEVIIVNDGDYHELYKVVDSFNDSRIRLIEGPKKGIAASLNLAISNSKGKYIARMDSDDIAIKDRIVKQLQFLNENKLDICGTNIKTFDSTNYIIKFPEFDSEIKFLTLFGSPMAHPTVFGKANVFKNYQYNEGSSTAEDYELWAKLAKAGMLFGNLQEPLLLYRIHSSQGSKISEDRVRNSVGIAKDYAQYYFDGNVDQNLMNLGFGFYNEYSYNDVSVLIKTIVAELKKNEIPISIFEKQIMSLYSRINNYSFNVLIGYYRIIRQHNLTVDVKFLLYIFFRCLYRKKLSDKSMAFFKKMYR